MTIHLYQQDKQQTFRLSERALRKLGFNIRTADDLKGIISAQKPLRRSAHCSFMDLVITKTKHYVRLSVVTNLFSGNTASFIADAVTEELFLETLHDMLRIQPPDNPLKLSQHDDALASGY